MNLMRAALLLTGLAVLAFAGGAAASDYMLVPLLEGDTGTVQPNAPPAEPQSLPAPAAPGSFVAMVGALVAAAAVTLGGFWYASRRSRA